MMHKVLMLAKMAANGALFAAAGLVIQPLLLIRS